VERILIATDGTAAAAAAIDCGLELAAASEAEVAFLHVLPAGSTADGGGDERSGVLGDAAARARSRGVPCTVELARGEPAEVILSRSRAIGAGLIVVGSRGRGGRVAALLGTVSRTVLRASERPVLIVHPPSRPPTAE
jgi:nucleotide-binding universal stress UspA family protein